MFSNLFSVSNNSTNFELLEERDGQYYLKNSGKLFSGLVYNIDGRSDGNIRNGKKSGKFTFYYDNGQIKKVGYYQNNFQQRRWKYYYESGQLHGIGSYINGNGSDPGVDSDIPKHGRIGNWFFYHENGGILEEQNWKNGHEIGYHRTYYDNGQMEWESYYKKDGTRDESKPSTKWYKNGHVWYTGYWGDDTGWVGPFKEYYENGQLRDTGYSVRIDGKYTWNGLRKTYNQEGDLIKEETYKDGKLINSIEY